MSHANTFLNFERYKVLSKILKRFKKEFNLTQKDVLENAHISIRNYQDYEYGKVVPTTATVLTAIADFYDISLEYLVGCSITRNKMHKRGKGSVSVL